MTLLPSGMVMDDSSVGVFFNCSDQQPVPARYQFRSFDAGGVLTSEQLQLLTVNTTRNAPASRDDIADRVSDAVLETHSGAPVTWALADQNIRLRLGGFIVGDWDVTFAAPVEPFRLDGTWTRKV
ncbi:hypothetical protein OG352_22750 [Streptomyces sp. NBC_01485]|uniref:hypothetical protein n=1 Tax=Streptomyces sp. NBC_01485 TaxID=2903884 RepID=UPI002E32A116|nr:hypothetical protein [Streptomyces sp. NBC_01485]